MAGKLFRRVESILPFIKVFDVDLGSDEKIV
jgi:hypothetical protein